MKAILHTPPNPSDPIKQKTGEACSGATCSASCCHCNGTGAVDSGGFTPWGGGIDVMCPTCKGSGALDREHNVITRIEQLDGWRITGLRRWKEGVVQYAAFRKTGSSAEQKIGYAKDEVFADLQIPSPNSQDRARR